MAREDASENISYDCGFARFAFQIRLTENFVVGFVNLAFNANGYSVLCRCFKGIAIRCQIKQTQNIFLFIICNVYFLKLLGLMEGQKVWSAIIYAKLPIKMSAYVQFCQFWSDLALGKYSAWKRKKMPSTWSAIERLLLLNFASF